MPISSDGGYKNVALHTVTIIGDVSDSMFSVTNSGASAGEIRILAVADRESTSSYSINVRVSSHF